MESIVVYLFDAELFDRYNVENATYEELDNLFKNRIYNEEVQKFSLKAFQYALNDDVIDDVNHWVVFATKK